MLNDIHIRDLATIEELHLHFQQGSTMITGETGAGKSIFIEAIELALGGRASANLVRPGKEKAEITLGFDVANFPAVIERLKALDLYHDMPECLIRRVITNDGRSRCYVNGSPATLVLAKELGELLFHLHGQHQQQVLLQSDTQREMLDRYGNHLSLAQEVKHLAENWKSIAQDIKQLQEKTLERAERSDYLQFQLDELNNLHLQEGEWENLETEHKRLANAEELIKHLQIASQQLADNDETTVLSQLNEVRRALESIASVTPLSKEWLTNLNSIAILVQDLKSDLHDYLENTDLDPEKLQQIEERISAIFNLARKHKVEPKDLVSLQEKISQELNTLHSSDDILLAMQTQQKEIEQAYIQKANELTQTRQQAASKLAKEITQTIRSLSLPHGEFRIELEKESTAFAYHGCEKIIFLIKTNPDQNLQPLAKVVSGGELSRLSLAAHLALAHRTSIPTLVFDEVDTGLSGATAEKIGRLLRELGKSYQVFCVTHQAQVAACGHHHLLVEKYFIDKSTHTRLRLLDEIEKTKEIARMLGGEVITEKTLAHAQEMLEITS